MHRLVKKTISALLAVIMILSSAELAAVYAVDDKTDGVYEGTFACDWFDESIVYPYNYSDNWFSGSSFEYNHDIATAALCFAMASFNSFDDEHKDKNIIDMMKKCGYETTSYGYDTEGYDTVGVAFGKKSIEVNNEEYTLVNLAIRSGNYGLEWGGNLRIGKGINHEGFDIAKGLVLQYLNQYIEDAEISGKVKLFISGYSRGASIADLVAAAFDDGTYTSSLVDTENNIDDISLSASDRYTYTFEAPQCTRDESAHDKKYSNIFNIINPNDYVPKFVMDDWGFTHYGNEYYYPSADNCDNYDDYYKALCVEFDSMMKDTGKKSKDFFYNQEDSRSMSSTIDFIFEGLSSSVMRSQEYYADNYEDGVVVIAGGYLSQKYGGKDVAKTLGVSILATLIAAMPDNIEKIKSDGFRAYMAESIANSDAGANMTDAQIEKLFELLDVGLEFFSHNTKNILSIAGQLKTFLYVHQPYIALTWMRILTADDMKLIKNDKDNQVKLVYNTLTLKSGTNGRICADYDKSLGKLKWTSDDDSIAEVDKNGNVSGKFKGKTTITATLYSADNMPIAKASTEVTVTMNAIQLLRFNVKSIVIRPQ